MTAGCVPERAPVAVTSVPAGAALNAPLEIALGGPVDPLSVTPRSVRVTDAAGNELPCVRGTADGRLTIALVLDAARLASPPARVRVALAGAPSVHAVRQVDGRPLARACMLEIPLDPRLVGRRARLIMLGTRPVEAAAADPPLPPPWRLVYDQPLDPETLARAPGPVWRRAGGVALGEVPARVTLQRIVGARCEIEVLVDDSASLEGVVLDLSRWGARDLTGARPEPPLVVPLTRARAR